MSAPYNDPFSSFILITDTSFFRGVAKAARTARIGRARFYRARSASMEGTWLPFFILAPSFPFISSKRAPRRSLLRASSNHRPSL